MAKIHTETLLVTVSRLIKDEAVINDIIDTDIVIATETLIQDLVPDAIVEVQKVNDE